MLKSIRLSVSVFGFFAAILVFPVVPAAKNLSIIRDAEIENTIQAYAAPLFKAAGLVPSSVNIYLVKDRTLNAFVAGGQNLFIHTGLLVRSENADQVIGVIAHETGHIAGGHLTRTNEALRNSTAQTILGAVLGVIAAVGTGRGDVGAAVIAGSQGSSIRSFLRYSRIQESVADQAAAQFLENTGQSAHGLLEFLNILSQGEPLSTETQNSYMRSHPMSRERIESLQTHIAKSRFSDIPSSEDFQTRHRIMRAKLLAFLEPKTIITGRYKETDNSIESRYARAIAYYRVPNLEKALPLVDGLIAEQPNNAYFHELKGQMLFENGRVQEALGPYTKATELMPGSALLRLGLARAQLESNNPALLQLSALNFQSALQREPRMPFAWRQLAIAYGRTNQPGMSALALAEEALLLGNQRNALYQAGKAETLLPRGSIGWLKAQDIREAAQFLDREKK
ncbi:MAG: M48 family metalloprotease [Rhodospirillales bacterium]|nr:M48 family metalloprotease [Rhodospirillales bacterium]